MIDLGKKKNTQVMKACLVLFGITLALSFAGTVFASDSNEPAYSYGT